MVTSIVPKMAQKMVPKMVWKMVSMIFELVEGWMEQQ